MSLNSEPRGSSAAEPVIDADAFVASSAVIEGSVQIEQGVGIWHGAVLRGDDIAIRICEGANLQDGVVVHGDIGFDVIVERDATIGHRAVLHGCIVRQGGLVGMGAIVLDGAIVGEEAMVAAGSVVLPGSQIEPRTLWAGSPARFKRDLRDADVDNIRAGAKLYRSKAAKAVKGAAR